MGDIALPPNPVDGFGFPQKFQPRDLPVTVNKPGRADVSDKFGMFDIPDVKFDETRSTVSEAWSTEVGGSEFDAPGIAPPPAIVAEFDPMNDPVFAVAAAGGFDSENEDDRWSVDVAASVSNASQEPLEDRLAELEGEPQGTQLFLHSCVLLAYIPLAGSLTESRFCLHAVTDVTCCEDMYATTRKRFVSSTCIQAIMRSCRVCVCRFKKQ